jgi:L-histidine N-alpha-methyltransferase
MIDDVRSGLFQSPKSIPPVWFYDEAGSLLFDEITRLPEYYLTRAERAILEVNAEEIAATANASTLVEIGSGTSEKTLILLDAMAEFGSLRGITLLDISEEILREAAVSLRDRYDVDVHAVVGDFRSQLTKLPRHGQQLWAFLGSTIGNFAPLERSQLLSEFQMAMGVDDHLLLGTDLVKDPERLVAAYDDSAGVTAAFNKNVLSVLNRALGAHFDVDQFDHRAVWNPQSKWIEMRLRSRCHQVVPIDGLEMDISLVEGEEILTEVSSKFDPSQLADEFAGASMELHQAWTDPAGDFQLSMSRPVGYLAPTAGE